jgi:deazaflavin-dependent oxidoreductase (nitroreductase family)
MGGSNVEDWAAESYCYLTTTGRKTGRPHTIEIWFGVRGGLIYLLSGGGERSDWIRNLLVEPHVRIRAGGSPDRSARARVVGDPVEDAAARRLLASKYQGWEEGRPLSDWARTALPVVVEPD